MTQPLLPPDAPFDLRGPQVWLQALQKEHLPGLLAVAQGDRATFAYATVEATEPSMAAYIDAAIAQRAAGKGHAFATCLPTGEVHDLGCGFGTVLPALARRCPSARIVGHEAALVPFCTAWVVARLFGQGRVEVRWADLFEADLGRASAVVCFLYPGAMARLARHLPGRLPPGARVVSLTFAMPGWIPEATSRLKDLWRSPVYVYRVGG